jgi:membrane-bound serine protease (ClpP class)
MYQTVLQRIALELDTRRKRRKSCGLGLHGIASEARMRRIGILTTGISLLLCASCAISQAAEEGVGIAQSTRAALVLRIHDAIGPATSNFFVRTLEDARERGAALGVLELDTPGGLDASLRDMIRATLASPVPVATFVAPSGARAASAGTYLLYASHVAAMAPATNVGAATPIQIGGPPAREPPAEDRQAPPKDMSASERKAVNDAVAYIRGLAQLRGRNADWAETAVRTAASLSANEALEGNVIDVVAADIPELLRKVDGRRVKLADREIVLATQNLSIERVEPDWRTRVLTVLTNPNIAYLLLLVGVYGLLLEGYNPGAILPGVVGAVSLLLGLYALQILPVNYAGLGLMALGVALIVAEAFAPSFGVLGLGGIAAFVVGSIILLDTRVPGFGIARALIGGLALTGAVAFLATGMFVLRSRRTRVVTGVEQLLRETAIALDDFERTGLVQLHGEIWRAVSNVPVRKGQRLRVTRVAGLTLEVVPTEE